MHLSLVHQTAFVRVKKLDRIFNRNHVFVARFIDEIQHRGERGRFTAARWAGYKNQAARLLAEFAKHVGQAELLKRLNFKRNHTEDGSGSPALVEQIATKAGQIPNAKRKIELQRFLKAVFLRLGQHTIRQLLGLCGAKSSYILQWF